MVNITQAMQSKRLFFLLVFILSGLFAACSQQSTKFVPRTWHNLNAKYNSYFLAREVIQNAEKDIFENRTENYNRILDVMPFVDTTYLQKFDTKLQDCIKKAANIKNLHENSEWLHPGYLLIGKARHYLRDYDNAISTFKYINTKSPDKESQNQALIELMRTYIQVKDFKSAKAAMEAIRKRRLEKSEKRDFFLMRGHLFREQNDLIETAKSLGSAVKIMPYGEEKARTHFILGQIYQQLERTALAYANFKKVLKNNPSYELSFYARLYSAQVSELSDQGDVKKTLRYFKKLLNDEKNKDFKDKIYYEMALFELRREDMPKGIEYLNESVALSQNPLQKSYSYLKLGEINYDPLKKYELAKTYYDSVMANLPPNVENYKDIERRHKALQDFVEQLLTYRTQDSLQKLYRMDESVREDYINSQLTLEETQRQDQIEAEIEKQRKLQNLKNQTGGSLDNLSNNQWYFYNPASVQFGQEAFIKRFGRRPLADNWRRAEALQGIIQTTGVANTQINPDIFRKKEIQKRVERRKQQLYDLLPKSEEDIKASDKQIEDAAYELGRIYKFRLNEPKNAIQYFEILLDRFPQTKYKPEVLYFLYILHKDLGEDTQAESYKMQLIRQYPNAIFTKRIINPNWEKEARENEEKVKEKYKMAYTHYTNKQYTQAHTEIESLQNTYPNNLIEDKVSFLKILIELQSTSNRNIIKQDLQEFTEKYPSSELHERAKGLLSKIK